MGGIAVVVTKGLKVAACTTLGREQNAKHIPSSLKCLTVQIETIIQNVSKIAVIVTQII